MKSTVHQTLSESSAGRSVLAELGAPEPNGPILDLITEQIDARLVQKTIELTGLSSARFSKIFGVTKSTIRAWRYQGIKHKGGAAYFRLVTLEGIQPPQVCTYAPPEVVWELSDICEGDGNLMVETGMAAVTIRSWKRQGVNSSPGRWPSVFFMMFPFLFEDRSKDEECD